VPPQVVTATYHPAELNVEYLIPLDHLVFQTSEFSPPAKKVNRSSIASPGIA
jgi:hypothetical protein